MNDDALRAQARAWMQTDPDPQTRAATEALLAQDALPALRAAFGVRLRFGTAGLRGPLGPGPGCMNRALVRLTSAGLGRYLLDTAGGGAVAVGYDGRHGSRPFAEDTARVLGGLGFEVYLAEDLCSTPALAFAVTHLGCVGGVMVTASHNPPQDNGYKVYWGNGAQIIPPHDGGISACIDAVDPAAIAAPPLAELQAAGRVRPLPAAVDAAYATAVDALRTWAGPTDLPLVYTAMHGVGWAPVKAALTRNGYTRIFPVTAQVAPDPDFPTVAFPNPEEPGALDLALAEAEARDAALVLANDPDADRLAVAVPAEDGWRLLTGNQIGVLLADDLLSHRHFEAPLLATTVVSSQMLGRMAAAHGAAYAETLTGFKWIANAAIDHAAQGGQFVMGYEEAIGYSAGDVVRDKDGVSAALLFCDLAARARADGVTVLDRLEALYRRYGLHASSLVSVKLPGAAGAARIQAVLADLRATPPEELAGAAVIKVTDYLHDDTGLPPSNVLAFALDDGGRVLARPSGTEPKVKFYFEVVTPLGTGTLAEAEVRAEARLRALEGAVSDRVGL